MKLRFFFLSILAGAVLAAGCAQEQAVATLDEFRVEQSYLGLPLEGGIASTGFTATAFWAFDPESIPDWLTISPTSGGAGSDYIVFAADANTGSTDRTASLRVNVAGRQQCFTVCQAGPGAVDVQISTIKQVADGNDDEVFRIRGTVTGIAHTGYGNIYLEDGTGKIYIYGLVNAKGQYPKDAGGWSTFGVDLGDIITVQGPRKLYNGVTLELVDAMLLSVEKSLIEVDPAEVSLGREAGTFTVSVVSKANGMAVISSESWVRVTDIEAGDGDAAVYTFAYDENTTTATRTANIQFKATNSSKSVTVNQEGVPPTGQSVTEILSVDDGSLVETLPSVVMAKSAVGFVISDGTSALYVYDKEKKFVGDVAIGDNVKVFATKKTYGGIPELDPVTAVEKDGTSLVNYPAVKDITSEALTYEAATSEFIQFAGVLKVSGTYYNVEINGVDASVRQGSIAAPMEELNASAYDGMTVTVTGYFTGLSGGGKYLNIVATKITGANAKGTLSNPYTPSEAAAAVAGLKWTDNNNYESTDEVYVAGKICKIANKGTYTEGGSYGNASFYLSADGSGDGEFYVFRALYLGNVKYTSGTDIKVGDDVVICGKLMNYQNNTPETVSGKAYLYSLNGKTE